MNFETIFQKMEVYQFFRMIYIHIILFFVFFFFFFFLHFVRVIGNCEICKKKLILVNIK